MSSSRPELDAIAEPGVVESDTLPDITYPAPISPDTEQCTSPPGLQWKSYIEELRFNPDGSLREPRHGDKPQKAASPPAADSADAKGRVEVYSKSCGSWCSGYLERHLGNEVVVAFQLPGARETEWAKKQLAIDHPELRWLDGAPPDSPPPDALTRRKDRKKTPSAERLAAAASPCQETSLPTNWTPAELASYDVIYEELSSAGKLEPEALFEYLVCARLSAKVLGEILQVANPDLKQAFGLDEFRSCCRLLGHCQERSEQGRLKEKGGALRSMLRSNCLASPPAQLPSLFVDV